MFVDKHSTVPLVPCCPQVVMKILSLAVWMSCPIQCNALYFYLDQGSFSIIFKIINI